MLFSCGDKKLPFYGRHSVAENGDTIYHKIPDFSFLNQDSILVSQKDLSDYIYVTDFFFTTCPSICPILGQQLLQVHEKFANEPDFKIVSHTLDPKHDTPSILKDYAQKLNIDNNQWIFLWGNKSEIYAIAEQYYIAALEDSTAAGGINHSGKLVLVDKEGHIRGFYEGTEDYGREELERDIKILLKSYAKK